MLRRYHYVSFTGHWNAVRSWSSTVSEDIAAAFLNSICYTAPRKYILHTYYTHTLVFLTFLFFLVHFYANWKLNITLNRLSVVDYGFYFSLFQLHQCSHQLRNTERNIFCSKYTKIWYNHNFFTFPIAQFLHNTRISKTKLMLLLSLPR